MTLFPLPWPNRHLRGFPVDRGITGERTSRAALPFGLAAGRAGVTVVVKFKPVTG